MTDRAELARLAAAATPGPWGVYISYSGESGTPDELGLFVNDKAHDVDGERRAIISDFSLYAIERLPDLEYAAAAANEVPALLADIERLRRALHDIGYASHEGWFDGWGVTEHLQFKARLALATGASVPAAVGDSGEKP